MVQEVKALPSKVCAEFNPWNPQSKPALQLHIIALIPTRVHWHAHTPLFLLYIMHTQYNKELKEEYKQNNV